MSALRTAPFLLALLLAACARPPASPAPGAPDRDADRAIYEMFVRSATPQGTLRAATARLGELDALGIDVVWLMPIYPIGEVDRKGRLGSPYAITDYRGVDPNIGTLDDLRAFLDAAHALGLEVILDWVANHTAPDHPWVSEHPEWYTADADGARPIPPPGTDWTDVADLDYDAPGLADAMIAEMQFWIDLGVDGFRCDVAGMVPRAFWEQAIPALRAAAAPRRLFLLAEWGEPWVIDAGFDAMYGWDSYGALKTVWETGEPAPFLDAVGTEAPGRAMHFVTNHDETSWDAAAVDLWDGADGMTAAMAAMYGLPGPPLVYNGQEAAAPQRLNLFENETVDYSGPDLRPTIRRWFALRDEHAVLRDGAVRSVVQPDSPVIAYLREGDGARALVLVNPTDVSQLWTLPPDLEAFLDAPDRLGADPAAGTVLLDAYGSRLFIVES